VNARPWTETVIAMIKFVLKNKIAEGVSFSIQDLVNRYIYSSTYEYTFVLFLAD